MPLWRIFSHPSTFTAAQKAALAKDVTALYVSRGLPAFYVVVTFIDMPTSNMYVGGTPHTNFVRVVIEQIARALPDPNVPGEEGVKARQIRKGWMDKVGEVLKVHIVDNREEGEEELMWEHHIYETPRDLWRLQGLVPPEAGSEEEKEWRVKNRAERWEKL